MTTRTTLHATITRARRGWNMQDLLAEHPEMSEPDIRDALRSLVDANLVVRTDVASSRGAIPYWRPAAPTNTRGSAFDPTAPPRRAKFSPEMVAQFMDALPATTDELMRRFGVSQVQVVSLARRAQAVHSKKVWVRARDLVPTDSTRDRSDNAIGSTTPVTPITYAQPTETFFCQRRGQSLLVAQCYEDYLEAACKLKRAPAACFKCPEGQRRRDEYARGA